ncbi:ABC transporter ATP-binding protein [Microlunatus elymi]|uniref:ABC transporter ATP-binding protein n=1 Tax=Microlunatus elymi TaxID=2596828 RepID=A0A516PUE0_9ACTN|nr:ABC transporter ATP-binding protein [Microlunatus elymi]QDP94816.1 ABC transporter ATP-binding protein [Microlunatus elymi]
MKSKLRRDAPEWRRLLRSTFRPYSGRLVVVGLATVVTSVASIVTPLILATLVNEAFAVQPRGGVIARDVILLLLLPLIAGIGGMWHALQVTEISQLAIRDLRVRLFDAVHHQPMEAIDRAGGGHGHAAIVTDTVSIENSILEPARGALLNLTILGGSIGGMFLLNWQLSLVAVCILPLYLVLIWRIGIVRRRVARIRQERLAGLNGTVATTTSRDAVVTARTLGSVARLRDIFRESIAELPLLALREKRAGRVFFTSSSILFSWLPPIIYGLVAVSHMGGFGGAFSITVGGAVGFVAILTRLYSPGGPLNQLLSIYGDFVRDLAVWDRIADFLGAEEPGDEAGPRPGRSDDRSARAPSGMGLSLRDVAFHYSGDSVASVGPVSMDVPRGQLIAISGRSGAGKTTFGMLCVGLLSPSSGSVTLDGVPISDLGVALPERIGYLPQSSYILDADWRSNLLLGGDVADSALEGTLAEVGLSDRSSHSELGLSEPLGFDGVNLSGGERRRLALARVLLRKRELYVLDEPTAGLDGYSRRLVGDRIEQLAKDAAVIVITHDDGLLNVATRRLVIDRGLLIATDVVGA